MNTVKVAVTGAAGQIGYALLFRIASGSVFGPDTKVELQLLELEPALPALEGVKMELDDCAFPLLQKITTTSDAGVAMSHAPSIPKNRWFAMTALDENRARRQLAERSGSDISDVKNLCIWGNHSATQYPDFYNASIYGKPVTEVIQDEGWLQGDFIKSVQQRGAAIIKARGASSAASAANAVVDTIQRLNNPTPEGEWFSTAIPSDGSYGIPEGIMFSYPLRSLGNYEYEVVQSLELNEFGQQKVQATREELEMEREAVSDIMG